VALLAVLTPGVGLGGEGWLAGTVCALGGGALLTTALRRSARTRLGPADQVTLARAILVCAVTAMVADGAGGTTARTGLATAALALDAVDGHVARRTDTASPFGARFDMEVDAFLILVLSVQVAARLGCWVTMIGAMRYGFVAASWMLPWLAGRLPPSYARKTVAVIQGIALVVADANLLPRAAAITTVGSALVLLAGSFGRDVVFLWRHRPGTRGATLAEGAQTAPPRTPKSSARGPAAAAPDPAVGGQRGPSA
jgi:phosphatidylglycerophosphate synthase